MKNKKKKEHFNLGEDALSPSFSSGRLGDTTEQHGGRLRFSSDVYLHLESMATIGVHWAESFSIHQTPKRFYGLENITVASIDKVVGSK